MMRQAEHPSFRAVREGDEEAVQRVLAEDPSAVDLRGHMGATLLHTARAGEVTAVLLSYGASLDSRDGEGRTPLHNAGVAKARVLLTAGAEVDPRDTNGRTPLHQ